MKLILYHVMLPQHFVVGNTKNNIEAKLSINKESVQLINQSIPEYTKTWSNMLGLPVAIIFNSFIQAMRDISGLSP